MKNLLIYFIPFFLLHQNILAQDSLSVKLSIAKAPKNLVLIQEVQLHNYDTYTKMATLHIEAEHIYTGTKYNFKYALLEGYCKPVLIVGNNILNGQYAFTYKVQADFLKISGKADGMAKSKKQLAYYLTNNKREMVMNTVPINADGTFNVGKIVIADNVILGFYGDNKKERRKLSVFINDPLPANYYPVDSLTKFVNINTANPNAAPDSAAIKLFIRKKNGKLTKDELATYEQIKVTATKKGKTKLQLYIEQYVSSAFDGGADALTFDGFTDEDLKSATNLLDFLLNRVNGFTNEVNADTGDKVLLYRRSNIAYFLDGIQVEEFPWFVNPWEVAFIRIYKNGLGVNTILGTPAIAFFTKRGNFLDADTRGRIAFPIKGYNPIETMWQ